MKKLIDPRFLDDARRLGIPALIRRQDGIIHRVQALEAGMTRAEVDSRIRRGRWHRILPCVLSTTPEPAARARLWATALWAGPGSILAGRAALAAAGIIEQVPLVIAVYVGPARSHPDPPGIRSVRAHLPRSAWRWHGGLCMTSPARTALDLVRWNHPDPFLPLILRRNAASVEELRFVLKAMATVRGYEAAQAAVQRALDNPWSPPEQDLHEGLRAAGITGWRANSPVLTPHGAVRPDLFFDEIKLAVEVEGKKYHSEAVDPGAFHRDAVRRQALEDIGWFVLRFTPRQIADDLPGVVATIIRKIDQLRALYGLPPAIRHAA